MHSYHIVQLTTNFSFSLLQPVLAWNIFFGVILLAATILYPIRNYLDLGNATPIDFPQDPGTVKIPLYIGMPFTFAAIIKRGLNLFGKRMWIVGLISLV